MDYEPAESSTALFGGNSNWRGPIWFPVNFLLIESLQKFHDFTKDFRWSSPPAPDKWPISQVAAEISRRLSHIFLRGPDGRRPVSGGVEKFQHDPHWRDRFRSMSTFTGTTAAAWARAIRPDGRPW